MDSNVQLPINEKVDPISRQKWPANFKKFKFPARQKPKHLIQLPKKSLTRWPCWRLTTRLERTVTLTAVAQIVQNRRKQFTTIQSNSSNGPTRIGQFNFQRKFPKKIEIEKQNQRGADEAEAADRLSHPRPACAHFQIWFPSLLTGAKRQQAVGVATRAATLLIGRRQTPPVGVASARL